MNKPDLRPVSAEHLRWLRSELDYFTAAQVISRESADAVLASYAEPSARFSLIRLALALGGTFAGIGVIWLVAANLDQLSPLARFALVTALWLISLGVVWWLDQRRPGPLVEVAQGVSALAFGAVIMQSAQSLQVPAYTPALVGCWSIGAFALAYLARGLAPLLVGLITGVIWLVWLLGERADGPQPVAIGFLVAGAIAAAAAHLHHIHAPLRFSTPWRLVGAGLSLIGLFIACVPTDQIGMADWTLPMIAAVAVAALVAIAATVSTRVDGVQRFEPVAGLAVLAVGAGLGSWVSGNNPSHVTVNDWAHSGVAVVCYVAACVWFAVVAILRKSTLLMTLAVLGLVLFVTFQSFAVFARLIQGGWLFVVLGVVFVVTGLLAERGRRELAEAIEGTSA